MTMFILIYCMLYLILNSFIFFSSNSRSFTSRRGIVGVCTWSKFKGFPNLYPSHTNSCISVQFSVNIVWGFYSSISNLVDNKCAMEIKKYVYVSRNHTTRPISRSILFLILIRGSEDTQHNLFNLYSGANLLSIYMGLNFPAHSMHATSKWSRIIRLFDFNWNRKCFTYFNKGVGLST